MNTIKKFAALAAFALLAFPTFAGNDLEHYPELRALLNNDMLVMNNYWTCLDAGHNLNDVEVDPVYYIVPPTGTHKAFTVTITMRKENRFAPDETVIIVLDIYDDGDGNRTVNELNIVKLTGDQPH
ncbi:hypothetical protein [Acanthopleuribacter pedis]|uniref:Uncharacterized protein n=1 Tax=Acanthopleuribacter pedis TaxID=442870 RepID=A0A8J7QGH7_9BACT|nr:hypothetical protein [Acanthopleuribacter pedis]MBO1319916.1 hypothetical protein [Acanthopleuribacter pedis]